MQLKLHEVDLHLRHPFRIARGVTEVQPSLVVELIDGEHCGYGETVESDYYRAGMADLVAIFEQARPHIEAATFDDPAEFWRAMQPHLQGNRFAACALDEAAH